MKPSAILIPLIYTIMIVSTILVGKIRVLQPRHSIQDGLASLTSASSPPAQRILWLWGRSHILSMSIFAGHTTVSNYGIGGYGQHNCHFMARMRRCHYMKAAACLYPLVAQ